MHMIKERDKHMNNLTIISDEEFRSLIPQLEKHEYDLLEENCLRDGIRDAIVVWPQDDGRNIIVDGYNRWKIIENHRIRDYPVKEQLFSSREEAKVWIIDNQLGRRNLPKAKAIRLAKIKTALLSERGKARKTGNLKYVMTADDADSQEEQINTRREVSRLSGVSEGTIAQYEYVESHDPVMAGKMLDGTCTINKAYKYVKEEETQKEKRDEAIRAGEDGRFLPEEYLDGVRTVMGQIDLDPASGDGADRYVKAVKSFSPDEGLAREWEGNVWLSPPPCEELICLFVEKLLGSKTDQAIVFVPATTERLWFGKLLTAASAVVFPQGRIPLIKNDGTRSEEAWGQAFFYLGGNYEGFLKRFSIYGCGVNLAKARGEGRD